MKIDKTYILVFFVFLVSVSSEEWSCGNDCTATLKNEVLTISGTGKMKNYTASSNPPWTSNKKSIKSVVIENGITTIGNFAFYSCSYLGSVTIPNSVTTIGAGAFMVCSSMRSITIPDSVTAIGNNAFYWCASLTSVSIPNRVATIDEGAFSFCSDLKSVTISNSATKIGERAFSGCASLTSGSIETIKWKLDKKTGEMSFTGEGKMMDFGYSSSRPWYASTDSIKEVTIAEGITTIGSHTFDELYYLTSITIPNSVTKIGERAFHYCSSLTSIAIPNSVTTIGDYAFDNCSNLSSISVADENTNFKSIDGVLFTNSEYFNLIKYPPLKRDTVYTIPANVVDISGGAFANCTLLKTVKFCGKLNDYTSTEVVTGSSSFVVYVSPAFEGESFFGRPITKSLTEKDCPYEPTTPSSEATSSSNSHIGVIIVCVCVALLVVVVVIILFTRTKSKNKSIAMESIF